MPPQSSTLKAPDPLATATQSGKNTLAKLRAWPGDQRVAVGLSGGVDSSLTAALLVEAGWHVEGLTLWLMSGKGACCSEGLVDAAGICDQLGIAHHVVDSRDTFQQEIVEKLVEGYQDGITPLPCSRCNRSVKFGPMLAWANANRGLQRIATGHYARIHHAEALEGPLEVPGDGHGRHQLLRGRDYHKDQSYFLYDLSQEMLGQIVFPLGELSKPETRLEAERYGLRTAKKPESQDLCLADHHGSMRAFLDTYLEPRDGEIVLQDGTVVGRHDGVEHFTIGQRRGLGVAWTEPLHVVKIDPVMNRVVVAPRADAGQLNCVVGAVNWISMCPPQQALSVEVQVRYRSQPVHAELIPIEAVSEDHRGERPYRCRLNFDEEQFSIAPGQAAVFYAGDVVLGGGLIQREGASNVLKHAP